VAKSAEENFDLTTVGEISSYTTELSVDMQEDWSLADLRAVAIVQSWDDKEILQAAQLNPYFTAVENPVVSSDFPIQNFPNPFNPSTTIQFSLKFESEVRLDIFNQKGQKVTTLMNSTRDMGLHQVVWNGMNPAGKPVVSGIYLAKIYVDSSDGGRYTSVKKMILLK